MSIHFKKLKGGIDSNTLVTGGFNLSLLDFPGGPVVTNLLPMQGTWLQSLGWEDSTCHGANKPEHHNHWSLHAWSPCSATRQLTTMRSPHTTAREQPPLAATRESPHTAIKTHLSHKKLKKKKKKNHCQKWIDNPDGKSVQNIEFRLQIHLTEIYRTFHAKAAECIFFSSTQKTFPRVDQMLQHKTNLNKFKNSESYQAIFSDHNSVKLQIN